MMRCASSRAVTSVKAGIDPWQRRSNRVVGLKREFSVSCVLGRGVRLRALSILSERCIANMAVAE